MVKSNALSRFVKIKFTDMGDDQIPYDLFGAKSNKGNPSIAPISIIYGPNGAGKTTFASRLGDEINRQTAQFFGLNDAPIALHDAQGMAVLSSVFNEAFINEKVLLTDQPDLDKGVLSAIVLFGEQVGSHEIIVELKNKIDIQVNERTEKQQRIEELTKPSTGKIDVAKEKLKDALRAPDGWLEYEYRITGKKPNITEKVIKNISEAVSDVISEPTSIENLIAERNKAVEKLAATKEHGTLRVPVQPYELSWDLTELEDLCRQIPTVPSTGETSDHFKKLLNDETLSGAVQVARKAFYEDSSPACPTCTQAISPELANKLKVALTLVLEGDERSDLLKRMSEIPQREILPDEGRIHFLKGSIESNLLQAWVVSRHNLSEALGKADSNIKAKRERPEKAYEINSQEISEKIVEYNKSVQSIEAAVADHNEFAANRDDAIKRAKEINLKVATKTAPIEMAANELRSLNLEYLKLQEEVEDIDRSLERLRKRIGDEEVKLNDYEIAINVVNKYLASIFADNKRLYLRNGDGGYVVYSRGKRVPTHKLSTGERNILALTFFFANVFEGSNDYEHFSQRRFLVLDDPLSSFDSDNKFGVFNFLRQMIGNFLTCKETQIVVLSHDMSVIREMHSVFKMIDSAQVATRKIVDGELMELDIDSYASYRDYLEKIYAYAVETDIERLDQGSVPLGIEMRLVLESFATFVTGADIVQLPKRKSVQALLGETSESLQKYFQGPLYKLLLHGESHKKDSLNDGEYDIIERASREERQRICRDLLCLMSTIAPIHVPSRLGFEPDKKDDFEKKIDEWVVAFDSRIIAGPRK